VSAGLPGIGLGGLFFIVSALLAPVLELWRTLRGRSSPAAWRAVGRQFAQAVAMIVAIDVALRLTFLCLEGTGLGDMPSADGATVLPLAPIAVTTAILATVLIAAKLIDLALRVPIADLPMLARPPLRLVSLGAVAATTLLCSLAFGASDLSSLSWDRKSLDTVTGGDAAGSPTMRAPVYFPPGVSHARCDSGTRLPARGACLRGRDADPRED
jgi:hypothetical protein